ncbi:hypothetical protein KPL70_023538 [Citrus sinensis]|nr:hypothetical protein KPL70_023538 [Citrus sinensis]
MLEFLGKFLVLHMHKFDSDKKRISVILGFPDRTLTLYAKGELKAIFVVTPLWVASSVENDLCILGTSRIEDKLQGVPEAIKPWALTGGKQETVVSTGNLSPNKEDDIILSSRVVAFPFRWNCSVVLCCRVAPRQTADMAPTFWYGTNDVSMIQVAGVGIGISVQEALELSAVDGLHDIEKSGVALVAQERFSEPRELYSLC